MAPYAPASDGSADGSFAAASAKDDESILFSLTERLREREDEVRQLRRENQDLEKQLLLQGKVKLDVAYEELLNHLKQREEDATCVASLFFAPLDYALTSSDRIPTPTLLR